MRLKNKGAVARYNSGKDPEEEAYETELIDLYRRHVVIATLVETYLIDHPVKGDMTWECVIAGQVKLINQMK